MASWQTSVVVDSHEKKWKNLPNDVAAVGAAVGRGIEAAVGDTEVRNAVGTFVCDTVVDVVGDTVGDAIGDTVENTVGDAVGNNMSGADMLELSTAVLTLNAPTES